MKHPLPNALARLCRRIAPAVLLLLGLAQPAWAALCRQCRQRHGDRQHHQPGVRDQCPYGLTGATCATGTALYGTWAGALNATVAANTITTKGFNDWRVPNKNELESIAKIDTYTAGQPAIDTTAFPGTPLDWFWTSTTYAPVPSVAWFVNFNYGNTVAYNKTDASYVRLVRSGQSFASFDLFAPSADLSITKTDSVTTAVPGASVTLHHHRQQRRAQQCTGHHRGRYPARSLDRCNLDLRGRRWRHLRPRAAAASTTRLT